MAAYNRTSKLPVWVVYISAHAGVDWDPVTGVLEYAGKAMGEQKPPAEQDGFSDEFYTWFCLFSYFLIFFLTTFSGTNRFPTLKKKG